ncbi:MAG: cation diffusion facilitator family transporter [Actinomycetota bacterium]|jgi:cobalt-zinc-cadmium efflux system protein|nr:cation diffusion facilitator family transporter [Actinomycetota bacterium]
MTGHGEEFADGAGCGGPEAGGRGPGPDRGYDRGPGPDRGPGHDHAHGHDHGHGARTATGRHRRALLIVMLLTLTVAAAEAVGAWLSGALVLLADAAHMAADAAGVGLSLLAVVFAMRPPTPRRTFGYARAEILAAVVNAVILLGLSVFIVVEAITRLISPPTVESPLIIVFGVVALAANATGLILLSRGRAESLNVRGAFLEVASDALGAVAVIVTGVIVAFTGFTRADPIAALGVGALILPRTWRLLADAVNVLLEASPRGIDLSEVRRHLTEVEGVRGVHDLHAWTITSGLPVLSVHVVVEREVLTGARSATMLDTLQACLRGHFDVEHSTFQLEPAGHAEHELPMHQ